jgi:hypothetical protein
MLNYQRVMGFHGFKLVKTMFSLDFNIFSVGFSMGFDMI